MMRRSTATELGLEKNIIGKWAGTQVMGCKPDEMGIGPAIAIPKLLNYTGVSKEEIGIWEINEAFASQAVYCVRELGIDESKVNPKGGAIAVSEPPQINRALFFLRTDLISTVHPTDIFSLATGARQLAGLLPEMERQGQQLGVISMCIGTGMGMASLIVRE
jgi:acetyl-CoA acyltransferase 1